MNNEEKILSMLEQMQGQMGKMESRQSRTETMLEQLSQGQIATNARLDMLEQKVTKVELVQENITNKTLSLIQEGMIGINKKFDKLDRLETRQEDHGHRIFAMEQSIKKQKAL